jgi:hypothetical protein
MNLTKMTAATLIAFSVPTSGASDTAQLVFDQSNMMRSRLDESSVLGLSGKGVFDELVEVAINGSLPGWDGFEAMPIQESTYRQAEGFLKALPMQVPPPSIGAEPDGHITMDWYSAPRQVLSVSVSPTGELNYAALLGPSKAYGTEHFVSTVPPRILNLISELGISLRSMAA